MQRRQTPDPNIFSRDSRRFDAPVRGPCRLAVKIQTHGELLCFRVLNITDVVNRVRNGESIPFRPQLPESSELGKQMLDMVRNCWSENAEHRPTFQQIRTALRKMTNGESVLLTLLTSSVICFSHSEYRTISESCYVIS